MWVCRASCMRICGGPDFATWRRKVSDSVEVSPTGRAATKQETPLRDSTVGKHLQRPASSGLLG
jgi:hypothetical protein